MCNGELGFVIGYYGFMRFVTCCGAERHVWCVPVLLYPVCLSFYRVARKRLFGICVSAECSSVPQCSGVPGESFRLLAGITRSDCSLWTQAPRQKQQCQTSSGTRNGNTSLPTSLTPRKRLASRPGGGGGTKEARTTLAEKH